MRIRELSLRTGARLDALRRVCGNVIVRLEIWSDDRMLHNLIALLRLGIACYPKRQHTGFSSYSFCERLFSVWTSLCAELGKMLVFLAALCVLSRRIPMPCATARRWVFCYTGHRHAN